MKPSARTDGGWNGPAEFQNSSAELLERVEIARKIYLRMLEKVNAERSQNSQGVY